MNEFKIYPKRSRIVLLSISSFIFVLIGAFFVYISIISDNNNLILGIIGIITVVFFGLCFLYYLMVFISSKPAVIISDEGINDHSSYLSNGLIKWEDIKDIQFIHFRGQVFLSITTNDPNYILNRSSGLKRMLNKMNGKLIESQINIPIRMLSCTIHDIVNEINRRRDGYFT